MRCLKGQLPRSFLVSLVLACSVLTLALPLRAQAPDAQQTTQLAWSRRAAELWVQRAQGLAQSGETAAAITAYSRALRSDATHGQAYLGLAELRLLFGDVREAEWLLARAAALPETRAQGLAARAKLYFRSGRDRLGMLDLEAAARAEPVAVRERELARAYIERRSWVAALAAWRRLRAQLGPQAPTEQSEAEETLSALAVLAGEADAVQHDMGESNWVRRALQRQVLKKPARSALR